MAVVATKNIGDGNKRDLKGKVKKAGAKGAGKVIEDAVRNNRF